MKRIIVFTVLAAALAIGAGQTTSTPTTQPMPVATIVELKQMHDSGEYKTCLQQIARVMMLRGEAARPYDPFALLLLRGDCLLHLEDRTTAYDAFTSAEKSTDPAQKAEAIATAFLIQKSTGLQFVPRPPADQTPISIVDNADRKKAMLALYRQMVADSKPMIDAALDAKNLAPIIEGTPTFIDIDCLEVAATGSNNEIHPTLSHIAEHARELMSDELTAVDQRVKHVENMANTQVAGGAYVGWWSASTRRGLTTDDREALRRDAAYADRINSAASDFQHVSRSLGSTGEKWHPIIEKSMLVTQHAREVLAAE
jgi:hypothetical protein